MTVARFMFLTSIENFTHLLEQFTLSVQISQLPRFYSKLLF